MRGGSQGGRGPGGGGPPREACVFLRSKSRHHIVQDLPTVGTAAMATTAVATWGSNSAGQLGLDTTEDRTSPCTIDSLNDTVVLVCAGDMHSAAVTESGALLTWGCGTHGQLGHGEAVNSRVPRPVAGLTDRPVCAVACGARHTLALTVSGSIFAWGSGIFGALGLGEVGEEVMRPAAVDLGGNAAAVAVACGVHHSLALTEAGCVMAWGWGRHGQLGDNSTNGHAFTPRRVHGLDDCRVVAICSGGHHVLARAADGACYGWGCNTSGRECQRTRAHMRTLPHSERSDALVRL